MHIPFLKHLSSTSKVGLLAISALLLASAAGCTYSHGPEPAPCNDPTPATYSAVIAPIIESKCLQCHGATVYQTLGGGHDYSSYQGLTKQSATLIMGSIRHDAGYNPMPKGQAKISDCDIARIKAWIDAGQPNN